MNDIQMDHISREKLCEYIAVAQALLDSMNAATSNSSSEITRYASFRTYMRKYNDLLLAVKKSGLLTVDYIFDAYNIENIPSNLNTNNFQQKELFDGAHANLSILKRSLENKLGMRTDKIHNLRDFLFANLRKAMDDIPEHEKNVQHAIELLLIGRGLQKGIDYDREVGRVKISIKEVIPDFIFPKLGLALEVKLSKDRKRSKEIVDEINADATSYGKEYSSILFVIYDVGSIRNEAEFKQDLELGDGVSIIIVKH